MRVQKFVLGTLLSLAVACSMEQIAGPSSSGGGEVPQRMQGKLKAFESDDDLNLYLARLASHPEPMPKEGGSAGIKAESEITNNQEAGVDEGDIVKHVDNYLAILRKGRLYIVDVAAAGNPQQSDSIAVAPTTALNRNVWYDELLVQGDMLFVVGYRYAADTVTVPPINGLVEFNSFRLREGRLQRVEQLFFESNDYFSGNNYASRLVDGKLLFYMPLSAQRYDQGSLVPHIPTWVQLDERGRFHRGLPLLRARDVLTPIKPPRWPVFHTLASCGVGGEGHLDCTFEAILSDWNRETYTTDQRFYLWTDDLLYAINLTNGSAGVHRVSGHPVNQFSFKEKEQTIHVVAYDGSAITVHHLKLIDFDDRGTQTQWSQTALRAKQPESSEDAVSVAQFCGMNLYVNRFIGERLLVSDGYYGRGTARGSSSDIITYDLDTDASTTAKFDGYVDRIEPLGDHTALIVANRWEGDRSQTVLTPIDLAQRASSPRSFLIDSAYPSDHRSHAFVYYGDGDSGVMGLPVVADSEREGAWRAEIVYVGFDGSLHDRGVVRSTPASDGVCETSCIDWYGNTRPIFFGGRAFSLMGSELQEVDPFGDEVQTLGAPLVLRPDDIHIDG